MELYVLDSLLRRAVVIDSFVSAVWTERYNDLGDLTLNIHSTLANRNLLSSGTMLSMNRSNRVMVVETVEDKSNTDGTQVLVITGSSLEIALDDRIARDTMAGTTAEPKWVISGLPAAIARQVFKNVMIDGLLDPLDKLPFYTTGNLYPTDTIAEPTDSVSISMDPQSVLAALKSITQTYDLGFRLTRNADNSQLFFNVYAGNDRTTGQTVLPAVIFSPYLDNLLDSSYLTSQKQYKNVAYVFCPDASAKVYETGVDVTVTGFSRRVLMVNASDITYADRTKAGAGGTAVYTVTAAQATAVQTVQALTSSTTLQDASLGKITAMQRLLPQDIVNITTALSVVFTLTSSQTSSISSAQSVAGVTADQVTALTDLGNRLRLTSAEVSALNTLTSNNTALTSTQKTDIKAAVTLQSTTVMPGEVTLINAAKTTSTAYNATEDAAINALLQARGQQELQQNNYVTAFDGDVPQVGGYRYGIDYYLGDIIEVRNQDGIVNNVRVTEQIMSQDSGGEKSYPTLSSRLVIKPGVWGAWDSNQQWADVVDTEHWADLP